MAYLIAQISDVHIGGPHVGNGERFSLAIETINAMTAQPDLVLLTGDLTQNGTPEEWGEFTSRLAPLRSRWEAIPGNHDRGVAEVAGHRSLEAGPLQLICLDASSEVFTEDDARWLDAELTRQAGRPTVIAVHQPPFETGMWWMDCIGLAGAELLEQVVRRHPHVLKVFSGHVHRLVQTNWGSCSLWACPSTAVTIAVDLDPAHEPAESSEAPAISLHAYVNGSFVSHIVPIGAPAKRSLLADNSANFVSFVRGIQAERASSFAR
jgi:3',5'-cyclic-AMP phosphodiesterase